MSAVKATPVADIDAAQGMPGAFEFAADDKGLFYICPCGCRQEGYLSFRPAPPPSWDWDGNREKPTLLPSIHHIIGPFGDGRPAKTHWHGYLSDGVWVSV